MGSRGNAHHYNRPKASTYTPLRIRAYLRTGIIGDSHTPIDPPTPPPHPLHHHVAASGSGSVPCAAPRPLRSPPIV